MIAYKPRSIRCFFGLHDRLLNIEVIAEWGDISTWETWETYRGDCPRCGRVVQHTIGTV